MQEATRARVVAVVVVLLVVALVVSGVLLLRWADHSGSAPLGPTTGPTTRPTSGPSSGPTPEVSPTQVPSGTQPVKVGVYGRQGTWWPGNGITDIYLPVTANDGSFPTGALQALLQRGTSLNITITARGTDYLAGIAGGDPTAIAWLTAYVENVGRVAAFADRLGNGTYVVATLFHEAQAQLGLGTVSGASADFATIGQAQERTIRLGHRLAPDAMWSVWLVGHDRVDEGEQLAQVTDPKPDLISVDPYANRDCADTLADIATDDLDWVREQPAYDGRVAISETGMNSECSDESLAAFYTDLPGQLRALGPDLQFLVVFNSDNGRFPHSLTDGDHPLALAALRASLTGS